MSDSIPPEPRIPKAPGVPRDLGGGMLPPPPAPGDAPDSEPPPASTRVGSVLLWLVGFQAAHPFRVLAVAFALTAVALLGATRLRMLAGFENLLPEDRPSVLELARVAERTAGVSTMFIVLQAPEGVDPPPTAELRRLADDLVPRLTAVGPPWVGSAESGVHDAVEFLAPRAGLYAPLEKLEQFRDDVTSRFQYEVNKDSWIDDDIPPPIDEARIRATFGLGGDQTDRFPDGYYQSKDGRVVVVAIRSKVHGADLERGSEAIARVKAVVNELNPASYHPSITWGMSGDLVTSIGEYAAINRDLREVGLLGAALLIGVVLLFYLRLRTLTTMIVTVLVGVIWAAGIAYVLVGHLNTATGFLFTILAGNGINSGIMFMARYLEVRRGRSSLLEGLAVAHRETWLATLTAASAAGASFGALLVSEFRGFRDFGLIGGIGMLLCWVATYLTLPAILAVFERISPIRAEDTSGPPRGILGRIRRATQGGSQFGAPFAKLVNAYPRAVASTGFVLAVVGLVAMVFYIRQDPMEYDLRNMRTDPTIRAEEIRLSNLADSITGHVGADGMAIVTERVEQVPLLEAALRARRDAAPEGQKPFADVHALQDFVPADQEAKLPVLAELRDKILRAKKRKAFTDEDWKQIEKFVPPEGLAAFGIADLPESMARIFTESDGTRGRIVYISPISSEAVDDARYLFRWADSYRRTELPDGSVVLGSGRAVIYADLWAAVLGDVPPSVIAAILATALVVLLAFRAGRPALAVLGALFVGIAWMSFVCVIVGVRLNFLNFIALPITFGIGVDYAVNIVHRYVREGAGGALVAVRETGGAVILCSLTTALGYAALVGSMNFGVRSLGVVAVIGELCCLFAAVLVLPAFLIWVDKGQPVGAPSRFSLPPRASRTSVRPSGSVPPGRASGSVRPPAE